MVLTPRPLGSAATTAATSTTAAGGRGLPSGTGPGQDGAHLGQSLLLLGAQVADSSAHRGSGAGRRRLQQLMELGLALCCRSN